MSERPFQNPSQTTQELYALEPERRDDKEGIRHYLDYLRDNVTPQGLLADRLAQANLDSVISNSDNPYPQIVFRRTSPEGAWTGTTWVHDAFMLKDDHVHMYYFGIGWPIDPSHFLREEDIVPFEDYGWSKFPKHGGMVPEQPFNKPLHRVAIEGGEAQTYNYNTGKWETEHEGGKTEGVQGKDIDFNELFF